MTIKDPNNDGPIHILAYGLEKSRFVFNRKNITFVFDGLNLISHCLGVLKLSYLLDYVLNQDRVNIVLIVLLYCSFIHVLSFENYCINYFTYLY